MSRDISVLKVFSSYGEGLGGHFHDIRHIVHGLRAIGKKVKVLNLGNSISPVLSNDSEIIEHLCSSHRYLSSYLLELRKVIIEADCDVVHIYDLESYLFVRLALFGKKIPLVMSKCGGPLPSGWYPKDINLITVSDRDYNFFRKRQKGLVGFIPNRVDIKLLESLQEKSFNDINHPIFLRIVRITDFYRESLRAFVNMSSEARYRDYQFILIGSVENEELYQELLSLISKLDLRLLILTDKYYTQNASRFLGEATSVFGTGRGAMEALILGKNVYTSDLASEKPTLITDKNFNSFLYDNFSERSDSSIARSTNKSLDECITHYLSTEVGSTKINEFYNSLLPMDFNFKDMLNLLRVYLVWKK